MPRYTNTAEQNEMARQYIQAAQERIKAGTLYVGTVQVKAITKANADKVFPPGCAAIVRRFLGVQSVPMWAPNPKPRTSPRSAAGSRNTDRTSEDKEH